MRGAPVYFSLTRPRLTISCVHVSTVLDRVKAFLPQIEEANKKLEEEIKTSGKCSKQIDADLLAGAEDTGTQGIAITGDGATAAATSSISEEGETVKLEFALGDFDNTAIAAMESAKDDSNGQEEGDSEHDDDDDDVNLQVLKTKK